MLPDRRNLLFSATLIAVLLCAGLNVLVGDTAGSAHAAPTAAVHSPADRLGSLRWSSGAGAALLAPAGATVILPNGTVSNMTAPISRSGSVYQLTGNLNGPLWDERNGTTIEGSGYRVTYTTGNGAAVAVANVSDVTLRDAVVVGAGTGIEVVNAERISLDHLSVTSSGVAITVNSSASVGVERLDANASEGIVGSGVSNFSVTSSEINSTADPAVWVQNGSGVGVWDSVLTAPTGMVFERSSAVTVVNDWVTSSSTGVSADLASGLVLFADQLTGGGEGIFAAYSSGVHATFDKVRNASLALGLTNDSNVFVSNESYVGITTGVLALFDENLTVNASSISPLALGVNIQSCSRVLLGTDLVSAYDVGAVEVANSSGVLLERVSASTGAGLGAYGLLSWNDHGLSLVAGGFVAPVAGWSDVGSTSVTVTSTAFVGAGNANGSAVELRDDALIELVGVSADRSPGSGISAVGTLGLTVEYSSLTHEGRDGLAVTNSSGLVVSGTNAGGAGRDAFRLVGDIASDLVGDIAVGSGNASSVGAYLSGVVGGNLALDNLTHQNRSVDIETSTGINVTSSNLSLSGCALRLAGDVNLSVTDDQAWGDRLAFDAWGDVGGGIYHNNFENDAGWLLPASQQSLAWDAGYAGGGNFWSNHTSPDAKSGPGQNYTGSDGIVDTPVVINATNVDRYPLTLPWTGYFLTLTESGLAQTTLWTVVVNGVPYSSYGASVVYPFALGPGATYQFTIPRVPGYSPAIPNASGPWTEHRANVLVLVTFAPYYHPLTLQEYGLAAGTSWEVLVGSLELTADTVSFTALLANGTYNYIAAAVPGYTIVVGSGVLVESGSPQTLLIVYAAVGGSSSGASVSPGLVTALEVGLVLVALIAVVSVALLLRARRRRPPSAPSPWATVAPTDPPRNSGGTGEARP